MNSSGIPKLRSERMGRETLGFRKGTSIVRFFSPCHVFLGGRTAPASAITNVSGSTINVASFTSSGYSKSGFSSQDTQLVAYSEDVIADAVNSNTARVAALETKLNAVLAALRAAGIIAP